MIAFSSPKIDQNFVRFVLTGVSKETDDVELLYSDRDINASSSDRIWRKLQGHEIWHTGSWESPPWRMGLVELKIKLRVFRSKKICFEVDTDEKSCLLITTGSGVVQLFNILASSKLESDHPAAKQMQHASFNDGEHVLIVVPPGKAISVHRAMYHTKNVTDILQSQLSSNPNLLSFGGDFKGLFGDPAQGLTKTLTIDYSVSLSSQNPSSTEIGREFEYHSSPLANIPFDSSKLFSVYSDMCISSPFKNIDKNLSQIEQYLQFHTGIVGDSPNQSHRLRAVVKLRQGIIEECGRHFVAISPWSTLLRCCGRIFSEHAKEFNQMIPDIDASSVEAENSSASPHIERRYCGNDNEPEEYCLASACLPFPGDFIVRLVSDEKIKVADNTVSYLGEYCRTLFSVSSRPTYQHSSGAYFLWYHTDRWCVGSKSSVGTSICIVHSIPSPGAGQDAPESSSDWRLVHSSEALTDTPGIRCLPGRKLPNVPTHQEALIVMMRSQFISALTMPDSTLRNELRKWLRSLPHDILKGTNTLDDNVPQILKTGMLDSFSWREMAYSVALSLQGNQGSWAEEFLVDLASAEGKMEYFVETLHAIQLSRPDSPCSAVWSKAHRLLLDYVDCPLLQDQAFLTRELAPENRSRFLNNLSLHISWASCLGEEAVILLVCFLRHLLRAAQSSSTEYLLQVAEKLSRICSGDQDLEGCRKVHAAEEASAADNSTTVVLAVAGELHSLAVTADGRLFAWGLDTKGRIGAQDTSFPSGMCPVQSGDSVTGAGSTTTPPSPVIPLAQGFAAVASSSIWAPVPILGPLLGRRVRTAASSRSFSLAITEDGCVFGWGILGNGTEPRALHQIEGFVGEHPCEAACGEGHNLVLCESGHLYAWGAADAGQLGLECATTGVFVGSPMAVTGKLQHCRCVRIACGLLHSAALTADGQLFMWGCAEGGLLGVGDLEVLNLPVSERGRYVGMPMQVLGPLDGKLVVDVSCGNDATAVLLKCGGVYGWGVGFEIESSSSIVAPHRPPTMTSFEPVPLRFQLSDEQILPIAISCYSNKNLLVVASDGRLYRYFAGEFSVEGLPQQRFMSVTCGSDYYLAVDNEGNLHAWGKIDHGRLGVGRHFPDLPILARETTTVMRVLFPKISQPIMSESLSRCLESKTLATLLGFDNAVFPDIQDLEKNETRAALRSVSDALLGAIFRELSDVKGADSCVKDVITVFLKSYIPEPQHFCMTPNSMEAERISLNRSVLEGLISFCKSMPDTRSLITKSSSIQDVGEWLHDQDVSLEIIKKFEEEKVDGSVLMTLTGNDLSKMGFTKLGPRKALCQKIKDLSSALLNFVPQNWLELTNIYRCVRMLCLNLESIAGFSANVLMRDSEMKSRVKLAVGSKVMLSRNYRNYGDANVGPLAPGEIGLLVDESIGSYYRVEAKGKRWNYHREAIILAPRLPAKTDLLKGKNDLSQRTWLQHLVKQVLNLVGHLISVVKEHEISETPLNKVGVFHLRDAICSLVSASAKIAAQIPGYGACFLSHILSKVSGRVLEGVRIDCCFPDLPEDLNNIACVSFMDCIESPKKALTTVFPSLSGSASNPRDYSAINSVLHSIRDLLRSESDFSRPPLLRPKGVYVAVCHIQTALLFTAFVHLKSSPIKDTLMAIIHDHWIANFMDSWKDFLLNCQERARSIGLISEFCTNRGEVKKLEDRMNYSLFRPLLPIFIFGLESSNWSYFPPSLISGLYEIHKLMKDLIDLVPEWQNTSLAMNRQLWRAPSHFCKWFLSSLHMIQALIYRKPFELYKGSESSGKWLDQGFIMTANSAHIQQINSELLGNNDFWSKVEKHSQTNHLLATKYGRLVKHATAVVAYHSAEHGDSYQVGDPQDYCQIFKECSKAVAHWAAKIRAEFDDVESACARALFLFELAPICGSMAADEFFEDFFVERPVLRRNSSRSQNDSSLSSWILEFIFDKSVDPTDIRLELNRRNQHLESCTAAISVLGLDRAQQLVDNYGLIGELLSAASRDRKHYLDGYGGAAVESQKRYQTAFLGVLEIALKAQPTDINRDVSRSHFGAFSALAALKLNCNTIKLLLDLRIWDILVDLLNKDQSVSNVKLGSPESLDSLVLPTMICFVIEAFQDLKHNPNNVLEWRLTVLNGLIRFLKADSAEIRTGLDLLALCSANALPFKEAIEYCDSRNNLVLVELVCCLFRCVIPSLQTDKLSEQGKFVSISFSFLSKIAQCFDPKIFDFATQGYSFAIEHKLVGSLPAGLRFLLVLTFMLGDYVEWEPHAALNSPPSSNRLIVSEATANFLAKLGRNTYWHTSSKLFCSLFLSPKTSTLAAADLELDERLRFCGITFSLCILGGWIPVIQEGGDAKNTDDELVAVLQYNLGNTKALIAKQDGLLHCVEVATLSPLSAKSGIFSTSNDLSLLLPFIQWHLQRVLSETDFQVQRAVVFQDAFMNVMTERSNKYFYFGRRQGAMIMKILADLAVVSPTSVYDLLFNQGEASAINALSQIALFCPEVEDFSNLQLTMLKLAERALTLQREIFDWLSKNTALTVISSKRLSVLQRNDTLGKLVQAVDQVQEGVIGSATLQNRTPDNEDHDFNFNDDDNQESDNGDDNDDENEDGGEVEEEDDDDDEDADGDNAHTSTPAEVLSLQFGKADVAPDQTGIQAFDIYSNMLDLSGVHRDLLILYSVNVAIELLPDYLSAILTASSDQESEAHVIMRLLQFASCIGVSSDRIENVLGRLLSSTKHGLPQFFLQVLLSASNPDKWVPQTIIAPFKTIHTMENVLGNSAKWESTLSFVGLTSPVKSVFCDPAFVLNMVEDRARVKCVTSRSTETLVVLEAQGAYIGIAESSHNYLDDVKYRGSVRIEGAQGLRVEFDHRCKTESGCDPMAFYIDEHYQTKIHEYSGDSWKDFDIEGKDTLYYTFGSDGSSNYWGYR